MFVLYTVYMEITPVEFNYLRNYKKSNGAELLKLTVKQLWLKGVVEIEPRWVYVNRKDRRKRQRYFFVKGSHFSDYNSSLRHESFLLDLFQNREEFSFSYVRYHVRNTFKKRGLVDFKNKCVIQDLKHKRLIRFFIFPNKRAKDIMHPLVTAIDRFDAEIKRGFHLERLAEELVTLGCHVINLQKESIQKIIDNKETLKNIERLTIVETLPNYINSFEAFLGLDFSFDHWLDSELEGFGGFGDGDFGGAGGSGDW